MATEETNIRNSAVISASKFGAKLFRNHVGAGWVCPPNRTKKYNKGGKRYVLLEEPRWMEYGFPVGSGDDQGFLPVVITSDMVGQKFARYVNAEAKTATGRPGKGQVEWHEFIWSNGGLSGFYRSDDEMLKILSGVKLDPTQ